jgi:hypothetical protein
MPEYQRKRRYIKYTDELCKRYIRIDFKYECSYCKTHEAESIFGAKAFEIDHFKPQAAAVGDYSIHEYDNLYYACIICNGASGKSNTWTPTLLDPCSDDIYGATNHIVYPVNGINGFKVEPVTGRGNEYIETLKLNQSEQRKIREKRFIVEKDKKIMQSSIDQIEENIKKLEDIDGTESIKKALEEQLVIQKEKLVNMDKPYPRCELDENIDACKDILKNYMVITDVFDDGDLDYEVTYGGKKAKAVILINDEIAFNNGYKVKKIVKEKVQDWKSSGERIIIFVYDKEAKIVYYCNFNEYIREVDLNTYNKLVTFKILQADMITESTISNLQDIFSK